MKTTLYWLQGMGNSMVIESFRGDYSFLSNFYYVKIEFDGETYPSVEHAYQAAKTLDLKEREKIQKADTPAKAKRLGKGITLRKDWETKKVVIMEELLRKKFKQKELKRLLLRTKNEELIEGNNWGDTFWGKFKGKGKNVLGKLIMKIRTDIKTEND